MEDDYIHEDCRIIYVVENIPGPFENSEEYEEILNNFNSQISHHCTCTRICSEDCVCIKKSGGHNFMEISDNKDPNLILKYESKDFKIYPILECNSLCKCLKVCGNRLVQNGPAKALVVKKCESNSKGFGLYTEMWLPKGTFICEYAGEIITKSQAIERHNINKVEKKMNYIYCLNEHCSKKLIQTFIDPSQFGNIGRYVNHSCDPNCVIIPVRVNNFIPKLAIFSSTDVLPGTELTFDYGSYNMENQPRQLTIDEKNRTKCLCNSKKCKDWMPFERY